MQKEPQFHFRFLWEMRLSVICFSERDPLFRCFEYDIKGNILSLFLPFQDTKKKNRSEEHSQFWGKPNARLFTIRKFSWRHSLPLLSETWICLENMHNEEDILENLQPANIHPEYTFSLLNINQNHTVKFEWPFISDRSGLKFSKF